MNDEPTQQEHDSKQQESPSVTETTTSTPQPPVVKRRGSRPLLVGVIAIIIAALGGAATLAVYKYFTDLNPSTKPTTSSQQKSSYSPREAIVLLNEKFNGDTPTDIGYVYFDHALRINNNAFYTRVDNTKATAIAKKVSYQNSDTEFANLSSKLKQMGFSDSPMLAPIDEADKQSAYISPTTVCQITSKQVVYNAPTGDRTLTVACVDFAEYEKVATQAAPLYRAYIAANPLPQGTALSFTVHREDGSQTAGYKIAEAGVTRVHGTQPDYNGEGSGIVHMYQTPDKTWHYFTTSLTTLSCNTYNTPDLKAAYKGEYCGTGYVK